MSLRNSFGQFYINPAHIYQIIIATGDFLISPLISCKQFNYNVEREQELLYPNFGVLPIDIRQKKVKITGTFSIQSGEYATLKAAANLLYASQNIYINSMIDFPYNTNITIYGIKNLVPVALHQFSGCMFSSDSTSLNSNSVETLVDLSFYAMAYKGLI